MLGATAEVLTATIKNNNEFKKNGGLKLWHFFRAQ